MRRQEFLGILGSNNRLVTRSPRAAARPFAPYRRVVGFEANDPGAHRLIAAFKIEQRGHAYVINARASTRSDVGITQDVGLELQILQTVLDYIPDADDSGELAIAQHRHVAHAMARHELHHAIDTLVGGDGDHAVCMISFTSIGAVLSP
jgi:hypothetical protein